MSRIVVSSDYHLDACTAGVPRLSDVAAAINETVDVAIEHKVDAWGFLGDAMDPDSGSIVFDCMEVLFEAVIRLQHEGIETFLIGGNHDCKEDGSGTTTLSPLRPLSARSDSIHLYEQPGAFKLATGLSVVALPYTASSHAYDTAKFLKEAVSKLDGDYIIASHLNLEGIHPGSESTDMPRGREVFFPLPRAAEAQASTEAHAQRPHPQATGLPRRAHPWLSCPSVVWRREQHPRLSHHRGLSVHKYTGELRLEEQLTGKEKASGDWEILTPEEKARLDAVAGMNRKQRRAEAARQRRERKK